jgi:hypothetical protein
MDTLIKGLKNFNLNKDVSSFDTLIDSLDDINLGSDSELDSEQEWTRLSQNYLKLKYIDSLLDSEIEYPEKFKNLLNSFLQSMDTVSQYYLREIEWALADPEIKEESDFIEKCLGDSLNISDGIEKLKKIIECYNVFIPLVESFRREHVSEIHLEDHDFVKDFSECKRRKIN